MKQSQNKSICIDCIKDDYLRSIVEESKEVITCSECSKNNYAISCEDLSKLIHEFFEERFTRGGEIPVYIHDFEEFEYVQRGEDLESIISLILNQDLSFVDEIISHLSYIEGYHPKYDFDGPIYDDTQLYVQKINFVQEADILWNRVVQELHTQRRFFSKEAKDFFDKIFLGIEHLWYYDSEKDSSSQYKFFKSKKNIIRTFPAGSEIFRARRADNLLDSQTYLKDPVNNLAPPPSKYALAGRMNAKGVTVFYGATSKATCIAEVRPSIGNFITIGCFKTTTPLKILDFRSLENCYEDISHFDPDYHWQVDRYKFLKKLHSLISKPILPGYEDEYLITQVLAEYLAYVRTDNFDGILFGSTQNKNGENIVLFPKEKIEEGFKKFNLEYKENSCELLEIQGVSYNYRDFSFSKTDSGNIDIHVDDFDE